MQKRLLWAIVPLVVLLGLASWLLAGGGGDGCQYTEREVVHERGVRIFLDSGREVGGWSVNVTNVTTGRALEGERCNYAITAVNEEPEPLRIEMRYYVDIPGGPKQKSLRLELDAYEILEIPQTERLSENGECSVEEDSFEIKFLDGTYKFANERRAVERCKMCGDEPCKNDGVACLSDEECGSGSCTLGTC